MSQWSRGARQHPGQPVTVLGNKHKGGSSAPGLLMASSFLLSPPFSQPSLLAPLGLHPDSLHWAPTRFLVSLTFCLSQLALSSEGKQEGGARSARRAVCYSCFHSCSTVSHTPHPPALHTHPSSLSPPAKIGGPWKANPEPQACLY